MTSSHPEPPLFDAEVEPNAPPPRPPRATALPLSPPGAPFEAPDCVPARMVNETLYCPRLVYLEWAQGEFADNEYTVEGRAVHRRPDKPGRPMPEPEAGASADGSADGGAGVSPPWTARSVWLTSERLGLTAKLDIVEGEAGEVVPVEYKRGHVPAVPEGAFAPERAQLCAQALLLREHGYTCSHGEIYFAADRRRVRIEIDEALIALTLGAARLARELTASGVVPPPLQDDPRCDGCSLVGICLPDEVTFLRGLGGGGAPNGRSEESPPEAQRGARRVPEPPPAEVASVGENSADPEPEALRRLHPARDDRVPLYVQARGGRIALEGECLVVTTRDGRLEARLPNTSEVSIFGNVQLTTPALLELISREIPVAFFSYGGWYAGRTVGNGSKNIELRMAQHRTAADEARCLSLARGFIEAKILNARTLLRRNHRSPDPVVLGELKRLAACAAEAGSLASLLGLEGTAARTYFAEFSGMLKGEAAEGCFALDGRNRRPPRDPINALLSFAYGMLTKDLVNVLALVGLEPLLGFFHQPRYGRPALALDLMEEFRPLIADSVVVSVLNNGELTPGDFVVAPTGVSISAAGRKRLIAAYERRMDQLVTHPVFGYRISYRRVLEVQGRLLSRVLLGELESYPSFRTR